MNKTTFEDYLRDIHADNYMGTDDDMADDFNDWLGNLDVDDWLKFGEEYVEENKHAKITRFELIDWNGEYGGGRVTTIYDTEVNDKKLDYQFQDDNRTLKVFIMNKEDDLSKH